MNINFAFIRHGYGCHNAMSTLVNYDVLSASNAIKLMKKNKSNNILKHDILPLNDPVLTHVGVEASIYNGCIVNKILRRMVDITKDTNLQMNTFNIVGCSPLIRCMETAYYMTRKWKNPPDQIYVFPLLREIDESSIDKYSKASREIIRVTPSYAIKSIEEQKDYLRKLGILQYFNFSFVESFPQERLEPGDIKYFMTWFADYFIPLLENKNTKNLNVFVTTHAGVLKDFSNEGFYNNSGFIINTTLNKDIYNINKYVSLNNYIDDYNFFYDYKNKIYNTTNYYCPSDRCGQLCSLVKTPIPPNEPINQIGLQCELDETTEQEQSIPQPKKIISIHRIKKNLYDKPDNGNYSWDFS